MATGDPVKAAQVDEFLDIFPADVVTTAQNHRVDGNFCPQFQTFHAVEGGNDIAAHCQRAVVLQQHDIVFFQIGFDGIGYLGGAGGAVGGQGHTADDRHIFNHVVHIHRLVRHRKAGSTGRVGVDDAPHIGALFIAAQMHLDFTGGAQTFGTFQNFALGVDTNEFFRGNETLTHTRRRTQKGSVFQTSRYVAIVRRNPTQLPHLVADITDLFLDKVPIHDFFHS